MSTAVEKQHSVPLGPRDAGEPTNLDEFETAEFEPGYRYELIPERDSAFGLRAGARA